MAKFQKATSCDGRRARRVDRNARTEYTIIEH